VIRLPAGYRLVAYDTVGSTNDVARELARHGAAAGTVVWALQQTAGRGRRGRVWLSPPGNLYASFVLRPDFPAAQAPQLSFVAALAVGDALAAVAPGDRAICCKWPNDILVEGRKIAGILVESETGEAGGLRLVVVGIGVNLASAPPGTETPATSVAALGGAAPVSAVISGRPGGEFYTQLGRWRGGGFAPVRDAWRATAAALGEPIRVRLDGAELQGRFRDIDEEGSLLLEAADGLRRISAGEVFPALC
jgi:BirA family transcriptional regulator, biotin operon repressor / biotin---[acetyl-CoA-carboxylase] ligase